MIVNAFALAFTSLLILAGVWLTSTMSGGCLKPRNDCRFIPIQPFFFGVDACHRARCRRNKSLPRPLLSLLVQ